VTLSEEQIKHLLVTAMAYDNRKPGEAQISAWGEAAYRGRWRRSTRTTPRTRRS
jgi:hypothetical protein